MKTIDVNAIATELNITYPNANFVVLDNGHIQDKSVLFGITVSIRNTWFFAKADTIEMCGYTAIDAVDKLLGILSSTVHRYEELMWKSR